MDFTPLPSELEELILCSCCHLPFNETDALPKLFSCRHYFCLKCVNQVLLKGNELYCVHCWKRTELTGPDQKPDSLPTHNAILYLSQNLSMISSTTSSATTTANKKPPDKTNGSVAAVTATAAGGGTGSVTAPLVTLTTTTSSSSINVSPPSSSVVSSVVTAASSSTPVVAAATSNGNGANGAVATGTGLVSASGNGGVGIGVVSASGNSVSNGSGSVIGGVVAPNGSGIGSGCGAVGSGVLSCSGAIGAGVSVLGGGGGVGGGTIGAIGTGKYRGKGENCLTHAMPNALWCLKCSTMVCRACASSDEHRNHTVKTQAEARDQIRTDIASDLLLMQKSLAELQHFVFKQRDFLLKILEACTALKTQVETELINHLPTFEVAEIRSNLTKAKLFLGMLEQQSPAEAYRLYANLHIEKQRLQAKYQEMYLQCKLDDLIQHYGVLFDFELIKQALSNLNTIDPITFGNGMAAAASAAAAAAAASSSASGGPLAANVTASGATINGHHNSILLLANYCISQLYSRHILTSKHHQQTASLHASGQQQQQHQQQQLQNQLQQHQQQQQQHHHLDGTALGYMHHSPNHGVSGLNHLHHHVSQQLQHHQQQQQQQQHQLVHHSQQQAYANQLQEMAAAAAAIIIAPPHQDRIAPGSGRTTATTADGNSSARTSGSGSGYLSEILNGSTSSALHHLHQQQQQQQQHSSSSSIGAPSVPSSCQQSSRQLASPGLLSASSSACSSVVSLLPGGGGGGSSSSAPKSIQSSPSGASSVAAAVAASLLCNPSVHVYPIYFFSIEINGQPFGRILIEVRNDVAPKMAKNFGALCTGELGFGYKGCSIFQCWENESIITGDFELNNGRGGRSVFEEGFFMPDDTKILAIRGSVGMRRSQKRHDNMGLVGSQFRIILREMRGFTGIFAFVVEGLDLVEKISQAGDSAGKPQSTVLIANCGKWQ
uniref:Putative hsp90 co-chaperone cpr7/cyclophilin n=1 Tax=Anopheles braziliensis TaxID=58242 RepID=A0A2M3Z1B7_9DIPT